MAGTFFLGHPVESIYRGNLTEGTEKYAQVMEVSSYRGSNYRESTVFRTNSTTGQSSMEENNINRNDDISMQKCSPSQRTSGAGWDATLNLKVQDCLLYTSPSPRDS